MAVSMSITIDDKQARDMLKKLATLNDLKKPIKQSGVYMEGAIGKRFRSADWVGLSEATVKIHPHRAGGKPLNDTGTLKRSVTSSASKVFGKNKLTYGTSLKYAPMHNFGGVGGYGMRIPKREFLFFDSKDEKMISRIFSDYVKELIK